MSYRRKARISFDVIERQVYVPSHNDGIFCVPSNWDMEKHSNELTPIFTAEIQVKVLWFWIPIWEESCDYSDADARIKLEVKAKEVYQSLIKEQSHDM